MAGFSSSTHTHTTRQLPCLSTSRLKSTQPTTTRSTRLDGPQVEWSNKVFIDQSTIERGRHLQTRSARPPRNHDIIHAIWFLYATPFFSINPIFWLMPPLMRSMCVCVNWPTVVLDYRLKWSAVPTRARHRSNRMSGRARDRWRGSAVWWCFSIEDWLST